jgi:hypothetical protein
MPLRCAGRTHFSISRAVYLPALSEASLSDRVTEEHGKYQIRGESYHNLRGMPDAVAADCRLRRDGKPDMISHTYGSIDPP